MGLVLGCGSAVSSDPGGETGSSTTEASTTTDDDTNPGSTTTSAGSTTFDGQTDTGNDTSTTTGNSSAIYGGSIGDPDGGVINIECDVWNQDCGKDRKCAPWANDGGSTWNATQCVPLDVDPRGVGEPCTAEGSFQSGVDTCDVGAVCIGSDTETLEGICVELCSGDPSAPICDETADAACVVSDDVTPLCRPQCDPRVGECPDGETCVPGLDGSGCVPA